MIPADIRCWCGRGELQSFSPHYHRCTSCNTLVSGYRKDKAHYKGADDPDSLYGKEYWTKHVKDLGFPDIYERARMDLTERDVFWLRNILSYKLPPAKSLELGCAHGGSVFLMHLAGYEAAGAEMSQWLCEFAANTFDVPMFCGDIDDIDIPPASLDIVVLMDVIEHFPDPVEGMKRLAGVLKPDGVMVIQTPCLRNVGKTFEQMSADNEMFLHHLKEEEHLYLFNEQSLRDLLALVGMTYTASEEPIFSYDMFVFASRQPLAKIDSSVVEQHLMQQPTGRVVLALVDFYRKLEMAESKQSRIDTLDNEVALLKQQLAETRLAAAAAQDVLDSLTWKLLAPVRKLCDRLRGMRS